MHSSSCSHRASAGSASQSRLRTQDTMGAEYTLFLLEDREGKPVAVLLPTEAVAAQEQVLPQVRAQSPRACAASDACTGSKSTRCLLCVPWLD